MGTLVTYELDDGVAVVRMDDGKVNALSPGMFGELNEALDRAEADGAIVVLTGRDGVFSAGFHLPTLTAGGDAAADMVRSGFELALRLLSFEKPVVIGCTGHAIAMGVFVLLSGDYRVGVTGEGLRIVANEVAIGLTMPRSAIEICRQRLAPAHVQRALNLSDPYTPDEAVEAGFLDRVVAPTDLLETALGVARTAAGLNQAAHTATKLRLRAGTIEALRRSIEDDDADLRAAFAGT